MPDTEKGNPGSSWMTRRLIGAAPAETFTMAHRLSTLRNVDSILGTRS
jgi:hypothetical protein